jgi:hypothetical protein
MKHRPPFLGIAAFCALCVTTAAVAQIAPGDTGAGIKRGMHSMNNSGEVGTVTLFNRGSGSKTLVVIELAGEPNGRHQPASIHRAKACDDVTNEPSYPLSPTINGVSRTLVEAPEAKLLSGNYVVVVHAADNHLEQFVSCGQLYQS